MAKQKIAAVPAVRLTPSERLLRELLAMSTADDGSEISDVIVIWTDVHGHQHMRSSRNEATE
jgi:hypothetical protein